MTGSATAARGTSAARALGGSDVPAPAPAAEPATVERPRQDVLDL